MFEQSSATRTFPNRCAAGRALGAELAPLELQRTVVLALPRGGVPVGYEVAHLLGAPLDVLVVRKVGAPGQPEFAIGAVASSVTAFDDEMLSMLGIGADYFEAAAQRERLEAQRREAVYRQGRPPLDLRDHAAILVDDGLATGSTMLAAVAVARKLEAAEVIVAVPVGARQACERLANHADRLVCLVMPEPFGAVGVWYEDFTQVDDAEVRRVLKLAQLEQEARYQPVAGAG